MKAQTKATITDPRYRTAFVLVTSLFFMWGLSYGLVDVLNKHFQETLNVSKADSGLIQAAYFGAYFVIALPAGIFMEKKGYKAGIILGLFLYALGALLFVPASSVNSFHFFLFALFVLALGLGCLETAANPYAAALGHPDTSETRLNFSQSFNGLGQFIGPLIGGLLFFELSEDSGVQQEGTSSAVMITYVIIAGIVLLIMLLFAKTDLPDLRSDEEKQDAQELVDGKKQSLWDHKEFVMGVFAQFVYVAAQVGVGAFFINLTVECWPEATSQKGAYLLSIAMICFMLGRFVSTGIMTKVKPPKMVSSYGIICIILTLLITSSINYVSVIALIALFFFISIMFPTIFAMGVKNLGSKTKLGSSCMIMSIVGGAIMPYFMGKVADDFDTSTSYLLPLVCFVFVTIYGFVYNKLSKHKNY